MNKFGKRALSLFLSVIMLLSLLPASALAAETDAREERLDTAEVRAWMIESYADEDEDGAVVYPAGALAYLLGMPDALNNNGRQVSRFTLRDEADGAAVYQLDGDELEAAAYGESPMLTLAADGFAWLEEQSVGIWVAYADGTAGYVEDQEHGLNPLSILPEDTKVVTFQFFKDEGGEVPYEGTTQILKAGEELQFPASPVKKTNSDDPHPGFTGWVMEGTPVDTGWKADEDFVNAHQVEGTIVKVTPTYQDYWHVTFLSANGETCYIAEVPCGKGLEDQQLADAEKAYVPQTAGNTVTGWNYDPGLLEGGKVAGDTTATAAGESAALLVTFDSVGGSTVNAVYPDKDGKVYLTDSSLKPVKIGCGFEGWYYDAEYSRKCEDVIEVTASITLYAKWNSEERNYTVQYWIENADDDGYSYAGSDVYSAAVGTELTGAEKTPEEWKNALNSKLTGTDKNQFTYDSGKTVPQTVKGDSSTILNLYFTRQRYKLTFQSNDGGHYEYNCGLEAHTHVSDCYDISRAGLICRNTGIWHTHSWRNGCYKLICEKTAHNHDWSCGREWVYTPKVYYSSAEVKYDASLHDIWVGPIKDSNVTSWTHNLKDQGGKYISYFAKMPAQDFTLVESASGVRSTWYYYLESLDETGTLHNDKYYYNYLSASTGESNVVLTYKEDYFDITGFTQLVEEGKAAEGWAYNRNGSFVCDPDGAILYYTRNSYTLTLSNGAAGEKDLGKVLYEKPLTSVLPDVASGLQPPEGKGDYTFGGWAMDPEGQQPVTDEDIMPAHDLKVYAIWKSGQSTVTLKDRNGDFTVTVDTKTVISNQDEMVALIRRTYPNFKTESLLGFLTDKNNPIGYPYSVNGDVTLIVSRSGDKTTVNYETGEGKDPIHDETEYEIGVPALVKESKDPAFDYWTIKGGDGTRYYPGKPITIQRGMILVAHYAQVDVAQVKITYHKNDGTAATYSEKTTVDNNDKVVLQGLPTGWDRTNDGYEFLGWAKKGDAKTPDYSAEDIAKKTEVRLDKIDSNDLYAVWALKTYTITVVVENGTAKQGETVVSEPIVVSHGGSATITFTPGENMALDTATRQIGNAAATDITLGSDDTYTASNVTADQIIRVVYAEDKIGGTDPTDPNYPGDGIPDKYQVTVQYEATGHGNLGGSKTSLQEVLTIFNEKGDWAETGNVTTKLTVTGYPETSEYRCTGWAIQESITVSGAGWDEGKNSNAEISKVTLENVSGKGLYTFKASFAEDTIPVAWDANGGVWAENLKPTEDGKVSQSVQADANVTEPGRPTKAGSAFAGWTYTDKEGKPHTYDSGTMTASVLKTAAGDRTPVTLTANWDAQYVIIQHFRVVDGEIPAEGQPQTLQSGETLGSVAAPYQKDYESGDKAVNGTVLAVKYLYAEAKTETVGDHTEIHLYYDVDEWVDPDKDPDPQKPGDGVPDKNQVRVLFESADETKGTVTGKGTVQVFTVIVADGETPDQVIPVDENIEKTPVGSNAFDIWVKDSKDSTNEVNPFTEQTGVNGGDTITFYARFEEDKIGTIDPTQPDGVPDKYQVTILYTTADLDKGAVVMAGDPNTQVFPEVLTVMLDGERAEVGAVTSKVHATAVPANGHQFEKWTAPAGVFTGWNAGEYTDSATTPDVLMTGVRGGVTYTFEAYFKAAAYTLIYNLNGGTWNQEIEYKGLPETYFVYPGEEPVREGYAFVGWTYGAGEVYASTPTVPMTIKAMADKTSAANNTVTLTAVWAPAYEIHQHFNGLTEADSDDVRIDKDANGKPLTAAPGTLISTLIKDYAKDYKAAETETGKAYIYDASRTTPSPEHDAAVGEGNAKLRIDLYYNVDSWSEPKNSDTTPDDTPDNQQILVKFESADEGMGTVDGTTTQVFNAKDFKPVEVTPKAEEGYAFDIWVKDSATSTEAVNPFAARMAEGGMVVTFYAKFAEDRIGGTDPENPGDGTPDKYQTTVTYKVKNGTWEDGTTTDKTVAVTLFEKSADGSWTAKTPTEAELHIPGGMKANSGFAETGKWDVKPAPDQITANAAKNVFTYTFTEADVEYTVKYTYDGKPGTAPSGAPTEGTGKIGAPVTVTAHETADVDGVHYVLDSSNPHVIAKLSANAAENVITVAYASDRIGTDPEHPDEPDGVADKYQATIIYQAASGGTLVLGTEETSGPVKRVVTITNRQGVQATDGDVDLLDYVATPNSTSRFVNWTVDPTEFSEVLTLKADLAGIQLPVKGGETYMLTANFTANTYTVVFVANGGAWTTAMGTDDGFVMSQDYKQQSVDRTSTQLVNVPSKNPVRTGYEFVRWTVMYNDANDSAADHVLDENGDRVRLPAELPNGRVQAGNLWTATHVDDSTTITVTAEWREVPVTYTVVQHFMSADGKQAGSIDNKIVRTASRDSAVAELEFVKPLLADTAFNGVKYIYSHFTPQGVLTVNGTVVDIYYDADGWKDEPDSETGGDGESDKNQVLVKFVSEDEQKGQVGGSTVQVFTPKDAESVTLDTGVEAKGVSGYAFDYWELNGIRYREIPKTLDVENGHTYVFTAYFDKDEIGEKDPEKPDNIPDKYQATVVYAAGPNGTLRDGGEKPNEILEWPVVITIIDREGGYAESGSVKLTQDVRTVADEGFAFDTWTDPNGKNILVLPAELAVEGNMTYTFRANFTEDTKSEPDNKTDTGDNTPDSHQATVVYKILNGTWADGTTGDKTVVVNLEKQDAASNSWIPVNPVDPKTPTGMKANDGFKGGGWDKNPAAATITSDGPNEFTYSYVAMDSNTLTIRYVDESGTELQSHTQAIREDAVDSFDVSAPARIPGYVRTSAATQTVTPNKADQTITFTYARDVLIDPTVGGDGNGGDGIPDSMQYTVTYSAANGSVSFSSTVVTKRDGNGNPSATGTARLTNRHIASASAAAGYRQSTLSWSPSTPTAGTVISGNTSFRASFGTGSRPYTPPEEEEDDDTTGGGGGGTTINDGEVPLAGDLQLNREDHFAYIKGYQDGTVRPNNPLTRAQVATIFYRLLDEMSRTIYFQDRNEFSDVPTDFWANKAISTLTNAGIITGFQDSTFRPNAYITRAQFAAIAARFDNVVPGLENPFSDVAEDYWARDLIAYAADRGWISGQGGKFRPLENITRVEAMDFINNVLERHVDKDGLVEGYTTFSDVPENDPNFYVVTEATNTHDWERREEGKLMENWTQLNEDPVWDE